MVKKLLGLLFLIVGNSLESKVDKLDADKMKPVPVG